VVRQEDGNRSVSIRILGFRRLVKEVGFPELCGPSERRAHAERSNWMKITTDQMSNADRTSVAEELRLFSICTQR
jgi:hypothetical protein